MGRRHVRRPAVPDRVDGGRRHGGPGLESSPGHRRDLPGHRLPLPGDAGDPRRGRADLPDQPDHGHPQPDRSGTGSRPRSPAVRPQPRPLLLPAQSRAAAAGVAVLRRLADRAAPRRGGDPPHRGVVQWDARKKKIKVNPIARWTQEQVESYIAEHGVLVNPLQDDGYPRSGVRRALSGCRKAPTPAAVAGREQGKSNAVSTVEQRPGRDPACRGRPRQR